MARRKKHWILRRLEYLRKEAKSINFSSGTTRRRKDLLEILVAINNPRFDFGWRHCFHLLASDDGATAKIILKPTHWSSENIGQIILEYPSFHNTHRMVFIIIGNPEALEIAKKLREDLCKNTFAFEYPLILKQGRKLTPIDPA